MELLIERLSDVQVSEDTGKTLHLVGQIFSSSKNKNNRIYTPQTISEAYNDLHAKNAEWNVCRPDWTPNA